MKKAMKVLLIIEAILWVCTIAVFICIVTKWQWFADTIIGIYAEFTAKYGITTEQFYSKVSSFTLWFTIGLAIATVITAILYKVAKTAETIEEAESTDTTKNESEKEPKKMKIFKKSKKKADEAVAEAANEVKEATADAVDAAAEAQKKETAKKIDNFLSKFDR